MTRTVVIAVLAFLAVGLFIVWILSGGPRMIVTGIRTTIDSAYALPTDPESFRLPWQPVQLFPTIDIAGALQFDTPPQHTLASAQQELLELEAEYDRLAREAHSVRTFGAPSPYRGSVYITQSTIGIRETDAHREFLEIVAAPTNTAPVDITGWSIESALTGARMYIPPAASLFRMGSSNTLSPVVLSPGERAIITSAPSPVGISFRENTCTGYLSQFQTFEPPLAETCPAPSQSIPLTAENLRLYGEECFDALATIPSCRFPQTLPSHISPACQAVLSNTLSYNGCVDEHSFRPSFNSDTWRLYLGASGELWRNSHDAVRLLDASGGSVSVLVY